MLEKRRKSMQQKIDGSLFHGTLYIYLGAAKKMTALKQKTGKKGDWFGSPTRCLLFFANIALNQVNYIRTSARNSCLGSIFSTCRITFYPTSSI